MAGAWALEGKEGIEVPGGGGLADEHREGAQDRPRGAGDFHGGEGGGEVGWSVRMLEARLDAGVDAWGILEFKNIRDLRREGGKNTTGGGRKELGGPHRAPDFLDFQPHCKL